MTVESAEAYLVRRLEVQLVTRTTLFAIDLVISGPPRDGDGATIIRLLSYVWPDAVVQRADDDVVLPVSESESIAKTREFFVYKTSASAVSWETVGRTNENDGEMFHVILGQLSITIVGRGSIAEAVRLVFVSHRLYLEPENPA